MSDGPKRILVGKPQLVRASAQKVSSAKKVMEDALTILDQQVELLLIKSGHGATLTPEESKMLQGYIKSLVDLSREERESSKTDPDIKALENMSDAELLELARAKLPKS